MLDTLDLGEQDLSVCCASRTSAHVVHVVSGWCTPGKGHTQHCCRVIVTSRRAMHSYRRLPALRGRVFAPSKQLQYIWPCLWGRCNRQSPGGGR